MLIQLLCFVSLQLTARLNVLDEHSSFASSSGFADNTQAFSPEKSASYTSASLTGHVPAITAILTSSDQYLAQQPSKEEPLDCSNSYSTFDEAGGRSANQEAPVEPPHYQKEPAISFGDIGHMMTFKVKWEV